MPWLKVSDDAAFHPVVTGPLTEPIDPDDRLDNADLVNLAFGLVTRCATHAAGYTTDYLVSDSTVALMGGPRWRERAELAARAGYWHRVPGGWVILDDPDHFVHIRLKAELEWERQRKRDNSDTALIIPVRLRDGDGCRYCGVIVNWRTRRGGRGGTYDHRVPGRPAAGPDDLLVACQTCNGVRSDHPDADERRPARPAPADPFYGADTVTLLAKHGYTVPMSVEPRPGRQPDHAPAPPRDPAASRTTRSPATPPPAGPRAAPPRDPAHGRTTRRTTARPGPRPDHAPRDPAPTGGTPRAAPPKQDQQQAPASPADPRHTEVGSPGRDGTGRETPTPTPTDRRRRRARRGRPQPPEEHHG